MHYLNNKMFACFTPYISIDYINRSIVILYILFFAYKVGQSVYIHYILVYYFYLNYKKINIGLFLRVFYKQAST